MYKLNTYSYKKEIIKAINRKKLAAISFGGGNKVAAIS